jgi:hypothetical protein
LKKQISEAQKERLTELQQKGFEIAHRYRNLPLQNRLNIIAQTFGCKTARVETALCKGKYHIAFDNDANLEIGNEGTPQAKVAELIDQYVNNALARFNPEIVDEAKTRAAAALLKREIEDNAVALSQ